MDNWVSYVFVILVTALITAIITENAVINRITLSDGVSFVAGKCRVAKGYGKLNEQNETISPQDQQVILQNIQNDVRFLKSKFE